MRLLILMLVACSADADPSDPKGPDVEHNDLDDTDVEDTDLDDTGVVDTDVDDTDLDDTDLDDTGVEDTDLDDTDVDDTGVEDTDLDDTGLDDTDVVDTGGGPTGDTGEPGDPPSPYADCVGVRTDSFGTSITYVYDVDGWLASWSGGGDSGTYSWVIVGGVPQQMNWSTASGSTGQFNYDSHGHPTSLDTAGVASTYTNTHDGGDKLTRSVVTSNTTASFTTTDYDACELWSRQEIDVFGDGSIVVVNTSVSTTTGDCVPVEAVVTTDQGTATTIYDSEGRPLSELSSFSSGTWWADWTWTCP